MSPRHKKDAFRICVTFLRGQMEIEPGSVSVSICQFQGWWKHHLVSYQLELPRCCSNTLVTEPWSISTKLLSIAKARHVPKMRKSAEMRVESSHNKRWASGGCFQIALKRFNDVSGGFSSCNWDIQKPKKTGSYVLALTSLWLDFAQPFYSQLSGSLPPARAKAP